jgi:hypothetical protein
MYRASLRFASRTYERSATLPVRRAVMSGDLKKVAGSLENLLSAPAQDEKGATPPQQNAPPAANNTNASQQQTAEQKR